MADDFPIPISWVPEREFEGKMPLRGHSRISPGNALPQIAVSRQGHFDPGPANDALTTFERRLIRKSRTKLK
jgi:hypothetical protein